MKLMTRICISESHQRNYYILEVFEEEVLLRLLKRNACLPVLKALWKRGWGKGRDSHLLDAFEGEFSFYLH